VRKLIRKSAAASFRLYCNFDRATASGIVSFRSRPIAGSASRRGNEVISQGIGDRSTKSADKERNAVATRGLPASFACD
jgi:hypothetical protein